MVILRDKNTNVIELYILKEDPDKQRTWYNSGIGTYAQPSYKSPKYYNAEHRPAHKASPADSLRNGMVDRLAMSFRVVNTNVKIPSTVSSRDEFSSIVPVTVV